MLRFICYLIGPLPTFLPTSAASGTVPEASGRDRTQSPWTFLVLPTRRPPSCTLSHAGLSLGLQSSLHTCPVG